jgi:hypothetical protein
MRTASYTRGGGDLMDQQVELDRRMLDWIVGLDTEMNELVEGSHLYKPKVGGRLLLLCHCSSAYSAIVKFQCPLFLSVQLNCRVHLLISEIKNLCLFVRKTFLQWLSQADVCDCFQVAMEQVVLPEEQKEMLLKTVDNFVKFRQYRKREGLEDIMSYGAGLVIMLCGASGTGKTMTVNAVAHHLGEPQYPPYGSEQLDASSLLIICMFYVHFQSISLNSFLHCWMWLLLCC